MRPNGAADPGQDGPGRRDIAYRLLATAVAVMRPSRRVWGQAMLAELEHVRSPGERASFALGATRVALFPPRVTPAWWVAPLGLAIRAVVAGAAIHALVPTAGPTQAMLTAVPAAGAWGLLTMPSLTGRPGVVALAAQAAVAAGVIGCVAVALTMVQFYPQVMGSAADHGWVLGVVLDVASAGYLGAACLLPRWFPARRSNGLYGLAAGLVVAVAAACYVAHPSLTDVWAGPFPGRDVYLLALLAVPAAAILASTRRGRVEDGLEAGLWGALLTGLIMAIMLIAATYRVAPSAGGNWHVVADAHGHGVASASVWLAGDNLGGAIISLIWIPVILVALAGGGAIMGRGVRATALNLTTRRPGP
jgi:hypothetical protein